MNWQKPQKPARYKATIADINLQKIKRETEIFVKNELLGRYIWHSNERMRSCKQTKLAGNRYLRGLQLSSFSRAFFISCFLGVLPLCVYLLKQIFFNKTDRNGKQTIEQDVRH